MASVSYIPPQGFGFRIVGYASQCAIYSRNKPDPTVSHINISHGVYPDQWFTLLHGTGNHAGLYAIKGLASGKVLFSRKQPDPRVGHIDGDGKYGDNWFKIEPHSGQYAGNFRLITPSQTMTLYSRPSSDPTFSNHPSTDFHADQLFYFIWEEVIVEKVEFDLAAGKILSSETITLAEQVLTNNSDKEEDLSFSINKSVTRSSTFEYGSGFTVTPGTEFSVGVPIVSGDKLGVEASTTQTWIWGKTTEYATKYATTFTVKAEPHQTIRATSVVNKGTLEVPFTVYLKSKRSGVQVQAKGVWRGVSSWGLRHTLTTL